MTATNLIQTAIWVIIFIVPGYLASSTMHYWMSTTLRQPADKTVESIIGSFVTYFVVWNLPEHVFNLSYFSELITQYLTSPEKLLFQEVFLKSYMFIMILACILGFLYVKLFPLKMVATYFHRTPYARVWDEFFNLNNDKIIKNGLLVSLKDGTHWIGCLKTASDTPNYTEIWLADIHEYKEGTGVEKTNFSDLLINSDQIQKVFILNDGFAMPVAHDSEIIFYFDTPS